MFGTHDRASSNQNQGHPSQLLPADCAVNAARGEAGAWAWERATQQAGVARRRQAALSKRAVLQLAFSVFLLVVVSWPALAVARELSLPNFHPPAIAFVLFACLLMSFLAAARFAIRSAFRAARRIRSAITARRDYETLTETTLLAAATDTRLGEVLPDGETGYWSARAIAACRASTVIETYAPGSTWWHDVALVSDPAVVFDHIGVGPAGVIIVQHVVMPAPWPLTVDPDAGLSFGGVPITGFGSADLMAWQLRAGSSAVRTAGLRLDSVTSIAVVSNASLIDVWGAPTGVERLQHHQALARLTYCVDSQLPAALVFDVELDADAAVLAVHQLAEGLRPAAQTFGRSPIAPAGTARRRRRHEGAYQEVNR
jgi:hypothetical protein